MTAMNVVRFRVRPGDESKFVEAHRTLRPAMKGFVRGNLVKTGERTFCFVGEWRSMQSIVDARPQMVALLDEMRAMLEDLGGGLGLTDPVSGEVAVTVGGPAPAKKKAKAAAKKRQAKRKGAKKKK